MLALSNRDGCPRAMGMLEEALQFLNREDDLNPNEASTLRVRGATNMAVAIHEEALLDLNSANVVEDNDAFTLSWLWGTKCNWAG
jgi:hypothetical protein